MSESTTPAIPLSAAERRSLVTELRGQSARIAEAWASTQFDPDRLKRWRIAGTEGVAVADLRESFIVPLFDLLLTWMESGDVRHRAVYRDERLRYAPHQASPADRARFFAEFLGADQDAVVGAASPTLREKLQAWLADLHAPLLLPAKDAVHLLGVGDCLINEIRVFLPDACRARGFACDVRGMYFSAFSGRDISTAQIRDFLAQNRVDLLAFSFLSYEGLPMYSALLRDAETMGATELEQRVTAIVGLMRRFLSELRELTDAPFLVHNASGLPLTRYRRILPFLSPLSAGRRRAIKALNASIAQLVENTPNALLIDEQAVAERHGVRAATKPVIQHARGALFHTARFGQFLATEYADVVESYYRLRKVKVFAVDFDNTLWDGVMADGPVVQHHDRQALLRQAREGGVLLVAVSKNDPANVRWDEMTLKPDDFVLQKIGWDLKVQSITAAAEQLDLGLDSFVFLDDNKAESELVRSQLPKVQVLDSNESFTWRSIQRLMQFPATKWTEEAKRRTEMYRQQALRREALSAAFDYPTMMEGLGLQLEFRRATRGDLDRLTELVQRTNQFNTTTKRYSRQQLQEFLASDTHRVYVAALSDKFGALGLVLVAIVERRNSEAVIDSFVMSCRAMGFQMEQAALALVLDAEADAARFLGLFVPTDRNTPAARLFEECGFSREGDAWTLSADAKRSSMPAWFVVHSEIESLASR